MSAHTPGPWEHTTGDTTVYADGVFVAETIPSQPWADDVPKLEAEANARLIAAAPDLLELVQSMVKKIDDHPIGLDEANWMKRARAALAKAVQS
jgi:hypothetical protein